MPDLLNYEEMYRIAQSGICDLSNRGLAALPAEIGQLTSLHTLRLDGNQLAALPAEIGQLTSLHTLTLDGNQLAALEQSSSDTSEETERVWVRPLCFTLLSIIFTVGAILLFPHRAAIQSPVPLSLIIANAASKIPPQTPKAATNPKIFNVSVEIADSTQTEGRIIITVLASSGLKYPGSVFITLFFKETKSVQPACSLEHTCFYAIPFARNASGELSAKKVVPFKGAPVAFDGNGATLLGELPSVTFWSKPATSVTITTFYHTEGVSNYDWYSGAPLPISVSGDGVTWNEPPHRGPIITASHPSVISVNSPSVIRSDGIYSFAAGALIGVAAATFVTVIDAGLSVITKKRRVIARKH